MQIYKDTASILAAASTHPDTQLRHLLSLRIESLVEFTKPQVEYTNPEEVSDAIDLADLMHVLVLQAGDTVADMFAALDLPCPDPALPDFYPPWEVIEAYGHWFELTFLQGDDGLGGVVVFVPDTADAELLAMCGRFAVPSQP